MDEYLMANTSQKNPQKMLGISGMSHYFSLCSTADSRRRPLLVANDSRHLTKINSQSAAADITQLASLLLPTKFLGLYLLLGENCISKF